MPNLKGMNVEALMSLRCAGDGDLASGKARCAAASLRSRQPVHQRAVPAADGRQRRRLFDEPIRQRVDDTWLSKSGLPLELHRAQITDRRVSAFRVVEALDIVKHAAAATKSLVRRSAPASWRATGPMAPGVCGETCWRMGCHVDCIGLSG
jgi:hypothetical protein